MTYVDPERIKAAVREHYREVAQSNLGTPCCRGDDTARSTNPKTVHCEGEGGPYRADELAHLPTEAVASSRGCGNPVALAELQPGEVVLDLGSGGGLDVLLAACRVAPQGFVYGLDMTDEMLALARHNAEKAGVTNVVFLKGDIEAIPLPDACVDVIISNCVLNLTPDKGRALREAFRVLKPGGRLAVSDIVIDGDLEGLPISEEELRSALSWVGCIAGALTVARYRQLLLEAGFEDIRVDIRHRFTVVDLGLQGKLDEPAFQGIQDLLGRFASSAITARRPTKAVQ